MRGKRHTIGNLELPKEKYFSLKEKLVGEIAGELKKNKKFLSVGDIPYLYGDASDNEVRVDYTPPKEGIAKMDELFGKTSQIVLGKTLSPLRSYEKWLLKYSAPIKAVKGALGTTVMVTDGKVLHEKIPVSRMVSQEEAISLGVSKRIDSVPSSLSAMLSAVAPIAYFTCDYKVGEQSNCMLSPVSYYTRDVYKITESVESKCSAYSSMLFDSEHIFGSHLKMLNSKFCISCYDSVDLSTCFEVDSSCSSSSCYFCHNVENVTDSLFCFNIKSKRYCVGNTEVGREEFLRIKKILLDYVLSELEKKRNLEMSIFRVEK